LIAWFAERRGFFGVLVPYVALSAVIVVGAGVYETKADQAELRVHQAQLAADLAAETAREAQEEAEELEREATQSCLARQEARADVDEVFRTIGAALPPTIAVRIAALLAARSPITC
jgi:hypothetical protein